MSVHQGLARSVHDAFARPDNAGSLGTAASGQVWQAQNGGTYGISGHQGVVETPPALLAPIATLTGIGRPLVVEADLVQVNVGTYPSGIVFRYDPATNTGLYWAARNTPSQGYECGYYDGNTFNSLFRLALAEVSTTLRVVDQGSQVLVFARGRQGAVRTVQNAGFRAVGLLWDNALAPNNAFTRFAMSSLVSYP